MNTDARRRFPRAADALPHVPLGCWPTPVSRLDRLSRLLNADLWIKRDDASGERFGGNKVRKLELLLADALAQGKRTVVTSGGIGSNHVVATALYARSLGLATRAVVFPQPPARRLRHNLDLARSFAELVPCADRARLPWRLWRTLRGTAGAYLIGPGGSSPLGTLGYVFAGIELRSQIDAGELAEPDEIVVPLGSGGTMAGLLVGLAAAGVRSQVIGVRVVERPICNELLLRALVLRTRRLLRRLGEAVPPPGALLVLGDQIGAGYGHATPAAEEACRLASDHEGLELELTYSGKAMAALIERCRAASRPRRVLFWNTFNSRRTDGLADPGAPPLPARIEGWVGSEETR